MKTFYHTIISLSVFFILLLSANFNSYSQDKQMVLLEQYTGAWCGWCVDGSVVMDELLEKHPDQALGVKLHYNDAMEFPEGLEAINELGVTAYPTGSINRILFSGETTIPISRGDWIARAEEVMARQPKAVLTCFYQLDKLSHKVVVNLEAKFLEDMSGDMRFYVYILEDNCTGEGTGWDQANYLSGREGYEDNPYYDQPSTIVGYHHMKVVRDFLGGPFGETGSVPATVSAGDVATYSFKSDLNTDWNLDEMHFIGVLCENGSGTKEIINAAMAVEGVSTQEITSADPEKDVVASGDSFDRIFSVKNISGEKLTYELSVALSKTTPNDWTVTKDTGDEITLEDGEAVNVKVSLKPGPTPAFGEATFLVKVKDDPDAISSSAKISAYSAEIEKFEINDDPSAVETSMQPVIEGSQYDSYISIGSDFFTAKASDFTDLKTIVWDCGEEGAISADEGQELLSLLNNGKNLLLFGTKMAQSIKDNAMPLLTKMGISEVSECFIGSDANGRIKVEGIEGESVSDGFSTTINTIDNNVFMLKIADGEKGTKPILKALPGDTVIAVKTQYDDSRLVLSSVHPGHFMNLETAKEFFDKVVAWVEGENLLIGPKISADKNTISFGKVKPGESKYLPLTLMNVGDEDLVITEIEWIEFSPAGIFTIEDEPEGEFSIAPGESREFSIGFHPVEEDEYMEIIDIHSNTNDGSIMSIYFNGTGTYAMDVKEGTYGVDGRFTVKAGPSPFSEKIKIDFDINGPGSHKVRMFVSDVDGNIVADLTKKEYAAGSYSLYFDGKYLPQGAYYIIAVCNGVREHIPIIFTK